METIAWIALWSLVAGGLIWSAGPHVLAFWRQIRTLRGMKMSGQPIWLRYKPTGKVLYLPAHYESKAVDELIRDLKEIPENVSLDSPLFERFSSPPPAPAALATV